MSFFVGMIAVCGIGSPSGRRKSAVTANQSASAPTIPASAVARTYPIHAGPSLTSHQRDTRKIDRGEQQQSGGEALHPPQVTLAGGGVDPAETQADLDDRSRERARRALRLRRFRSGALRDLHEPILPARPQSRCPELGLAGVDGVPPTPATFVVRPHSKGSPPGSSPLGRHTTGESGSPRRGATSRVSGG